jgi:hypothetical protein
MARLLLYGLNLQLESSCLRFQQYKGACLEVRCWFWCSCCDDHLRSLRIDLFQKFDFRRRAMTEAARSKVVYGVMETLLESQKRAVAAVWSISQPLSGEEFEQVTAQEATYANRLRQQPLWGVAYQAMTCISSFTPSVMCSLGRTCQHALLHHAPMARSESLRDDLTIQQYM